jgi:hypothetical protein
MLKAGHVKALNIDTLYAPYMYFVYVDNMIIAARMILGAYT